MNYIDEKTLKKANKEAIFNVYSYIADKGKRPANGDLFSSIVLKLREDCNNNPSSWDGREIYQLKVLEAAVSNNSKVAGAVIGNQINSVNGLNACTFTCSNRDVSVVFRGTAGGEWIDNGKGLSGIPEENTYIIYGENGEVIEELTLQWNYATNQQVEALNWFHKIASENSWSVDTNITISGHSKGGNKAQFVTIHSDLIDACYSFDGQGFSPEALDALEAKYRVKFEERRRKILSFATDNDYVNVLGEPLVPENQVYYFESPIGDKNAIAYHHMEAMLDKNGKFNKQCEQGQLSEYVQNISRELMEVEPVYRQFATLGIMNLFQKYMGKGIPANDDRVSTAETIVGVAVAIATLLANLHETKKL